MTPEEIKKMAEDYAAEYLPMYRRVATIAFIDGMNKLMEITKKQLESL